MRRRRVEGEDDDDDDDNPYIYYEGHYIEQDLPGESSFRRGTLDKRRRSVTFEGGVPRARAGVSGGRASRSCFYTLFHSAFSEFDRALVWFVCCKRNSSSSRCVFRSVVECVPPSDVCTQFCFGS